MKASENKYNTKGQPGCTPKHRRALEVLIDEPGQRHSPMTYLTKAFDFGIHESEIVSNIPIENVQPTKDKDKEIEIGTVEAKRTSTRSKKKVQLGEPGKTPRKEYFFYQETPPSFVADTHEEATRIIEQLKGNSKYNEPASLGVSDCKHELKQERFMELSSSEVSKYETGQRVENLGANTDITGIVSKIYGTRLCGTAGPGTIVIDTALEEPKEHNSVVESFIKGKDMIEKTQLHVTAYPTFTSKCTFSADEETLMNELLA